MPIHSISDITKTPLSKYTLEQLNKDVYDFKQNILSGMAPIIKIQEFDKLMKYIMKSKTFIYKGYNYNNIYLYIQLFKNILTLHPDENGLFNDEQFTYLFSNFCMDKLFLEQLNNRNFILQRGLF